ncbi:MAG: HEPN domain-containing protein [Magnetococcales bacterium]|nr:HEPN domain-containing protein [Magnetococcales bacterium]
MKGRNRDYCQEWLKKADHDLITARTVLAMENGPTDTPCFHAHQAVEKAFKGMLTFHGIAVGRTHDLLALFDLVFPFLPELSSFEESFGIMSSYAVETRYPGNIMEPDRIDAKEALQVAEQVVAMVETCCGIIHNTQRQ